jgi:hypothetical protein
MILKSKADFIHKKQKDISSKALPVFKDERGIE